MQANLARSESEGQRRMVELHNGNPERLEIAPNLWAGVRLVRGGVGTALAGSHDEVAERIIEYSRRGITHFILSGYPTTKNTTGATTSQSPHSRGIITNAAAAPRVTNGIHHTS